MRRKSAARLISAMSAARRQGRTDKRAGETTALAMERSLRILPSRSTFAAQSTAVFSSDSFSLCQCDRQCFLPPVALVKGRSKLPAVRSRCSASICRESLSDRERNGRSTERRTEIHCRPRGREEKKREESTLKACHSERQSLLHSLSQSVDAVSLRVGGKRSAIVCVCESRRARGRNEQPADKLECQKEV